MNSIPSPIPAGLCQCGCGIPTNRAKQRVKRAGIEKGEYFRFAPGHNGTAKSQVQYVEEDRGYKTPCWIWQRNTTKAKDGYGRLSVKGKMKLAHRVFYERAYGPVPDDIMVCHKCDVRLCMRPDHMFLGTVLDNNHDRDSKGRHGWRDEAKRVRGERNAGAKLTEDQVRAIRKEYAAKQGSQYDLARRYGVARGTIEDIVLLKTWTHVA